MKHSGRLSFLLSGHAYKVLYITLLLYNHGINLIRSNPLTIAYTRRFLWWLQVKECVIAYPKRNPNAQTRLPATFHLYNFELDQILEYLLDFLLFNGELVIPFRLVLQPNPEPGSSISGASIIFCHQQKLRMTGWNRRLWLVCVYRVLWLLEIIAINHFRID